MNLQVGGQNSRHPSGRLLFFEELPAPKPIALGPETQRPQAKR